MNNLIKIWTLLFCLIYTLSSDVKGQIAYVANMDSNSIALIDTKNNFKCIKNIEDGINGPSAIAISPDKRYLYVANSGNNSIAVIDIVCDHRTLKSITQDINCPYGLAVTPNGKYVYVTNFGNDCITIIDAEHNHKVVKTINQSISRPYAISLTPSGKFAYVTNLGDNSITVIDIENHDKIISNIKNNISNPYAISFTPSGSYAYVVNGGNNTVSVFNVEKNHRFIHSIEKDLDNPYAIAISPNGKYAFVANYNKGISVIDIENNNSVIKNISSAIDHPYSIYITPDNMYAYVSNLGNNTITILDLFDYKIAKVLSNDFHSPYMVALLSTPIQQSSKQLEHKEDMQCCYLHDEHFLSDEKEGMLHYLKQFPIDEYEPLFVTDTGFFYIDRINDPIKNTLREKKIWEEHVHNEVKKYALPGTNVLDIGAHIGTETILMAQCVGKDGHVFSYEPQKKNFRELWANCLLNHLQERVTLFRMAIGSSHNTVEIGQIVSNSSGEVDEGGIGIWGGGDKTEMRTIDSFNFKNVSLVKIDVEGCENAVLDGMVNTIRMNKPVIIIEICGGWPWNMAPPDVKRRIFFTQQKLIDLGYEVKHLNAWDYIAFPINNNK